MRGHRPPRSQWLALGQAAEITRTFSEADLQEYRDLSGDTNPAFSDAAYGIARGWPALQVPGRLARRACFPSCWARGCRAAAPIGSSSGWPSRRRVIAGQEVTARVEIVRLRPEKDLVNLRTTCTLPAGRSSVEGEALVLVKDLEHA